MSWTPWQHLLIHKFFQWFNTDRTAMVNTFSSPRIFKLHTLLNMWQQKTVKSIVTQIKARLIKASRCLTKRSNPQHWMCCFCSIFIRKHPCFSHLKEQTQPLYYKNFIWIFILVFPPEVKIIVPQIVWYLLTFLLMSFFNWGVIWNSR